MLCKFASADNRLEREQVQLLNEHGEKCLSAIYCSSNMNPTDIHLTEAVHTSLAQTLTSEMDAVTTIDELQFISNKITKNFNSFNNQELGDLQIHFEKRKEEINQIDWIPDDKNKVDAEDFAITIRNADTLDKLKLVEYSILSDLREEKISRSFGNFLLDLVKTKKQELIAVKCDALIEQVKIANTVDEANQPVSETIDWTDEQRIPLLAAISKRLVELDVSLLNQIRNAPSMAILNSLLSEVENLAPGTYPHQCMEAYAARKNQLTQATA
jgi:hypothetical protein